MQRRALHAHVRAVGAVACGVLEEAGSVAAAQQRRVERRLQRQLPVQPHILGELAANRVRALERREAEVVLGGPRRRHLALARVHERLVHVEQRQRVALLGDKLAARDFGADIHGRAVVRHEERRLDRGHGGDAQHLVGAAVLRGVPHLCESAATYRTCHHRRERRLGELLAERQEPSVLVERLQRREVRERLGDVRGRRRGRHVLEARDVVDAERLELQHVQRHVDAHELGDVGARQRAVRGLGVQAQALARRRASSAASALLRGGLGHRHSRQDVDAARRVEVPPLCVPGVDDEAHAVDGDARLGDVGREDDLAGAARRRRPHGVLVVGGQARVQRQELHRQRAARRGGRAVREPLHRVLDLVAPGEEEEQVARRLAGVPRPRRLDGGGDVVTHGRGSVRDLDGVGAPLDREHLRDGRVGAKGGVKEARERLGVDRRAGQHDAQLGALASDPG